MWYIFNCIQLLPQDDIYMISSPGPANLKIRNLRTFFVKLFSFIRKSESLIYWYLNWTCIFLFIIFANIATNFMHLRVKMYKSLKMTSLYLKYKNCLSRQLTPSLFPQKSDMTPLWMKIWIRLWFCFLHFFCNWN